MENLLHILKLIKPTNVKTTKIAIHFPTYTHRQTHADTETRIGKYSEQQQPLQTVGRGGRSGRDRRTRKNGGRAREHLCIIN